MHPFQREQSAVAEPISIDTDSCSQTIESRIDGTFEGWSGDTIFKLTNGQIWQQVSYGYLYSYKYRPVVTIFPSSGRCKMHVEGVRQTIIVKKISSDQSTSVYQFGSCNPPIESRIDGTFEGWSGDTIFKLMNGQIWQQASYAYRYSYKYLPAVIIYPSSIGCKMRVDGVDGSIVVKRLR